MYFACSQICVSGYLLHYNRVLELDSSIPSFDVLYAVSIFSSSPAPAMHLLTLQNRGAILSIVTNVQYQSMLACSTPMGSLHFEGVFISSLKTIQDH